LVSAAKPPLLPICCRLALRCLAHSKSERQREWPLHPASPE